MRAFRRNVKIPRFPSLKVPRICPNGPNGATASNFRNAPGGDLDEFLRTKGDEPAIVLRHLRDLREQRLVPVRRPGLEPAPAVQAANALRLQTAEAVCRLNLLGREPGLDANRRQVVALLGHLSASFIGKLWGLLLDLPDATGAEVDALELFRKSIGVYVDAEPGVDKEAAPLIEDP